MIEESHDKINIDSFEGLYSREEYDAVPPNFFQDCLNVVFENNDVKTREGLFHQGTPYELFTFVGGFNGVIDMATFTADQSVPGVAVPIYFVKTTNSIIDVNSGLGTVYTLSGTQQRMRGITAFNKLFYIISGSTSALDNFFWVYTGTGVQARKIGGAAPTGATLAAVSSAPGNVERGTHVFKVVFETESGFVTAPGNTQLVAYAAIAADKVNLSGIPTGPAGTAKRRILVTRAILNYDGDSVNREYFFLPNGTINDNVTTILNNVSFFDADLFESADFTLDQLSEVPSFRNTKDTSIVGGVTTYRNRLILWTDSQVYVSEPNEPESYDAVNSIILIDVNTHGFITACAELRGQLYIFTKFRTFVTSDNGDTPNSWELILVDTSNGAIDNGVATMYLQRGNTIDYLLIKGVNGIFKFVGVYDSELTEKIRVLYGNNIAMAIGQMGIDEVNMRIYTVLDGANTLMLVGDYSRGLTPESIRWTILQFFGENGTSPTTICAFRVFFDVNFNVFPVLMVWMDDVGLTSKKAYILKDTQFSDDGRAVPSFIDFNIGPGNRMINHFVGWRAIVTGNGNLNTSVYWTDRERSATLRVLPLSAVTKEKFLGFNVVAERLGLRLSLGINVNDRFRFRKIVVYMKELYQRYIA